MQVIPECASPQRLRPLRFTSAALPSSLRGFQEQSMSHAKTRVLALLTCTELEVDAAVAAVAGWELSQVRCQAVQDRSACTAFSDCT